MINMAAVSKRNGSFFSEKDMNEQKLTARVLACLPKTEDVQLIVIDGMCGSGKSTLAGELAGELNAPIIHMDDFFLPYHLRTGERLSQPGGNVDYERFEQEVLPFAGKEDAFQYRRFSCSDGSFSDACCPAGKVRIVEGSYSLHPRFLPVWQKVNALRVFLSVEEGEQLKRISLRNPDLVENFRTRWIPMENAYFAAYSVAQTAQLCLESKPL